MREKKERTESGGERVEKKGRKKTENEVEERVGEKYKCRYKMRVERREKWIQKSRLGEEMQLEPLRAQDTLSQRTIQTRTANRQMNECMIKKASIAISKQVMALLSHLQQTEGVQ